MKLFNCKSKRKPQLYRKCNELPIHNFNEVSSNNDFTFLKKNNGDVVNDEDLQLAWLDILDEYLTISNNAFAIALLKKKAKIILLEKKLHVLEVIKFCVDRCIDIDSELLQYRIKKDKVAANIGMVKNDINRLSSSIPDEAEQKKRNTDFDRSIAMLNKNGFNINRFTTVVSEWVEALNILEKQNTPN
jgi:hypothetical protein